MKNRIQKSMAELMNEASITGTRYHGNPRANAALKAREKREAEERRKARKRRKK